MSIHPREILREEYLIPPGMSVNALAMQLRIPATRLHEITKERRGITEYTAMRLARYFAGDAQSWLNLQSSYELRNAKIQHASKVREEIKPYQA